jgi:hypothetical protein
MFHRRIFEEDVCDYIIENSTIAVGFVSIAEVMFKTKSGALMDALGNIYVDIQGIDLDD